MVISPRSFAERDYFFTVPTAASGEMILEFSQISRQKLVFKINPPLATAETSGTKKSSFTELLRDAAPEGSPKAFEPSRFFQEHISGYEPFYFIAGTESPNAKFQISFKYQLLNRHGYLAENYPSLERFYVAYTQTSLWDWNAPSAPFFDSSYKPEFLYAWEKIVGGEKADWFRLDMQVGLQHESNGKGGSDSRSLNIGYVRPTLIFGEENSLQLTLQPRAWFYVGDLDDNPDLPEYRGYADLRAIVGWRRGLQLSATGRIGDIAEHGSLQLDLTYPMMRIFYSNFSVYLHAQYFTGYGESLLRYNERSSVFRVGFSMYR
jgi:outer membrane phospholipase A